MGKNSKIAWCSHSWNTWHGCETVSPACDHCYAMLGARRNPGVLGVWGPQEEGGTRVLAARKTFTAVLKWDEEARVAGERHRVFTNSISDVFEDWRGPMLDARGAGLYYNESQAGKFASDPWHPDHWPFTTDPRQADAPATIDHVRTMQFILIAHCPALDFLVLTKRIGRVSDAIAAMRWPGMGGPMFGPDQFLAEGWKHVKIGTTAEDQEWADRRVPDLLSIKASVHFVSYEPALGPVDWTRIRHSPDMTFNALDSNYGPAIGWLIVGGESKAKARPFDLQWARDAIRQGREHGVPVFVKQVGSNPVSAGVINEFGNPWVSKEEPAGTDSSLWPRDLVVQEFYASV